VSEYRGLIEPVARELLGDPNPRHSRGREWRYGTNGSLSVDLDKDVWTDHEGGGGGGVLSLIARATGGSVGEARQWLVERGLVTNSERSEVCYDYVSEHGEILYQVVRMPGHEFRQRRPNGAGGWVWNTRGLTRVLYRLPQLLTSEGTVYLVEGEKDADTLASIGLTATTSGAANSWRADFARVLAGRDVIILPDNDDEGRKYASSAAKSLAGIARSVRTVELPGLPRKGDVSDWLADGGTRERLLELCASASTSDTAEPPALRPVSLANVMQASKDDWPCVVSFYFPRRVTTLLGGHGGVGKSMLALILAAHVAAGRPWGGLEVDHGRAVYLSFEDEADVVLQRLRRIIEHYELSPDAVQAHLRVFDGSDAETELAVDVDGDLVFTPMMGVVTETAHGAALLIIDNASDTYGGNENERRQVRGFIRRLAKDAKANDGAVVLLAHVDKQAAKGSGRGNNYSGSTQWHNSVRSRLALVESDEAGIELLHEKANYGPKHEPVALQRVEGGVMEPIPAAVAAANRSATRAMLADADADAVLDVMVALFTTGATIPTAETGQRTTWHVLNEAPELPEHLRGRAGKDRVKAAVMANERAGRIRRETYRTVDHKDRQRWALAGNRASQAA